MIYFHFNSPKSFWCITGLTDVMIESVNNFEIKSLTIVQGSFLFLDKSQKCQKTYWKKSIEDD